MNSINVTLSRSRAWTPSRSIYGAKALSEEPIRGEQSLMGGNGQWVQMKSRKREWGMLTRFSLKNTSYFRAITVLWTGHYICLKMILICRGEGSEPGWPCRLTPRDFGYWAFGNPRKYETPVRSYQPKPSSVMVSFRDLGCEISRCCAAHKYSYPCSVAGTLGYTRMNLSDLDQAIA